VASAVLRSADALPRPLHPVLTGINNAVRAEDPDRAAVPGRPGGAHRVNKVVHAVLGKDNLPLWSAELPGGGRRRCCPPPEGEATAVYLPAST
jgi:hypothetical protein